MCHGSGRWVRTWDLLDGSLMVCLAVENVARSPPLNGIS
jgi:hypothetical protein